MACNLGNLCRWRDYGTDWLARFLLLSSPGRTKYKLDANQPECSAWNAGNQSIHFEHYGIDPRKVGGRIGADQINP